MTTRARRERRAFHLPARAADRISGVNDFAPAKRETAVSERDRGIYI